MKLKEKLEAMKKINKQGNIRCIRGDKDANLKEGKIYQVVVVIYDGIDYRGQIKKAGYILEGVYPYVWDADRFEYIQEKETDN